MSPHGNVCCPFCGERHSEVADTRWKPTDRRVRRVHCLACNRRFSTVEFVPTVTRLKSLFGWLRLSTKGPSS